MRAAAVQLSSTDDKDRNLDAAERLVRAASADGATLIVLPEKFNLIGTAGQLVAGAETLEGRTAAWARSLAAELGVDLVAGSIAERREGRDKISNTCLHFGAEGDLRGVYRKIHMFDVTVEGREYRESDVEEAGGEIVLSEARDAKLGLAVCYDLRFPELFRVHAVEGARVLTLPSAFTRATGAAHWDTLIRARAIENQAFVVAADQVGRHPNGDESFGGSQIVDPWGDVLARVDGGEGYVCADLDFKRQDEIRVTLPSLSGRVPEAYARPSVHGTSPRLATAGAAA